MFSVFLYVYVRNIRVLFMPTKTLYWLLFVEPYHCFMTMTRALLMFCITKNVKGQISFILCLQNDKVWNSLKIRYKDICHDLYLSQFMEHYLFKPSNKCLQHSRHCEISETFYVSIVFQRTLFTMKPEKSTVKRIRKINVPLWEVKLQGCKLKYKLCNL